RGSSDLLGYPVGGCLSVGGLALVCAQDANRFAVPAARLARVGGAQCVEVGREIVRPLSDSPVSVLEVVSTCHCALPLLSRSYSLTFPVPSGLSGTLTPGKEKM